MPTKIASCWAFARTPASPTIPIAKPAAYKIRGSLSDSKFIIKKMGEVCQGGQVKFYSFWLPLFLDTYQGRETADETGGEVLVTITELVVLFLSSINVDYSKMKVNLLLNNRRIYVFSIVYLLFPLRMTATMRP
jgi:hypothetical protein